MARAKGFNKVDVGRFYTQLKKLIDEHKFTALDIYIMDESGIRTVLKNCGNVVALRGKKQVGSVTSAEHGITKTAVCCENAAGAYLPPMLIFMRKRMNPIHSDGAPAGTLVTISENGYITKNYFWSSCSISLGTLALPW